MLTIYGQFGQKKSKILANPSVRNQGIWNEPFFEWLSDVTKDYGATKGDRRKAYVEEGLEQKINGSEIVGGGNSRSGVACGSAILHHCCSPSRTRIEIYFGFS